MLLNSIHIWKLFITIYMPWLVVHNIQMLLEVKISKKKLFILFSAQHSIFVQR